MDTLNFLRAVFLLLFWMSASALMKPSLPPLGLVNRSPEQYC